MQVDLKDIETEREKMLREATTKARLKHEPPSIDDVRALLPADFDLRDDGEWTYVLSATAPQASGEVALPAVEQPAEVVDEPPVTITFAKAEQKVVGHRVALRQLYDRLGAA